MALGSGSLGSLPFGGSAGAGVAPVVVTPSAQVLLLALQTPTIITIDGTVVAPAAQTLALTLQTPLVLLTPIPEEVDLGLSVQAPLIHITIEPAIQSLSLVVGGVLIPTPEVKPVATTLSLTLVGLDVLIPTIAISSRPKRLRLEVTGPNMLNPRVGYLNVVITRYISDPVQTGGCPQCGTLLYDTGRDMKTDQVVHGRHWESRYEDDYTRCARCGFPVKRYRHPAYNEGDWVGWGLRYDEIATEPVEPFTNNPAE